MRYNELVEGRVYRVDWGYSMPVTIISNPSPPQARTLIAAIRRQHDMVYLRGLMFENEVYIWNGGHMTHDDVRSQLLPDVSRYSTDVSLFEVKDYTISGYGADGIERHAAKVSITQAGDCDPAISPFVKNIMVAIDTKQPDTNNT
jgi:hypothetical protein